MGLVTLFGPSPSRATLGGSPPREDDLSVAPGWGARGERPRSPSSAPSPPTRRRPLRGSRLGSSRGAPALPFERPEPSTRRRPLGGSRLGSSRGAPALPSNMINATARLAAASPEDRSPGVRRCSAKCSQRPTRTGRRTCRTACCSGSDRTAPRRSNTGRPPDPGPPSGRPPEPWEPPSGRSASGDSPSGLPSAAGTSLWAEDMRRAAGNRRAAADTRTPSPSAPWRAAARRLAASGHTPQT
jgi:hypothetical protein